MKNPEESAVNEGTFPEGRLIRSSLPSHAVGNLLEVRMLIDIMNNVNHYTGDFIDEFSTFLYPGA